MYKNLLDKQYKIIFLSAKAHLPESIICVPKNGQYKMDKTGALLLNYLRTKASQKKDVISNYIELLVKKLKDLL